MTSDNEILVLNIIVLFVIAEIDFGQDNLNRLDNADRSVLKRIGFVVGYYIHGPACGGGTRDCIGNIGICRFFRGLEIVQIDCHSIGIVCIVHGSESNGINREGITVSEQQVCIPGYGIENGCESIDVDVEVFALVFAVCIAYRGHARACTDRIIVRFLADYAIQIKDFANVLKCV